MSHGVFNYLEKLVLLFEHKCSIQAFISYIG